MNYYTKQKLKGINNSIELSSQQLLALSAEFTGANGQFIPLESEKFDQFINWYTKKEQASKTWVDFVLSGEDWYREQYLHPTLEKKILSIEENATILDIGCGAGNVVIPNLKKSHTYFGVDISRYALEAAAKIHDLEIIGDENGSILPLFFKKKCLSFEAFSYDSWIKCGNFDQVILSQVIHNLSNYKLGIHSLFQTLKSGGKYFIATFNSEEKKTIESFFETITKQEENFLQGNYTLPNGPQLKDIGVYVHENGQMFNELQKYSSKINSYSVGEIFQIFEGIKK